MSEHKDNEELGRKELLTKALTETAYIALLDAMNDVGIQEVIILCDGIKNIKFTSEGNIWALDRGANGNVDEWNLRGTVKEGWVPGLSEPNLFRNWSNNLIDKIEELSNEADKYEKIISRVSKLNIKYHRRMLIEKTIDNG